MAKDNTLLYRSPGVNRGPGGRTYDWIASLSEGDTDNRLREGWFLSLDEAIEAAKSDAEAARPVSDDPSMTAGDKAAAAKKALVVAAERALAAKRALAADTEAAVTANKALDEATARAEAAEVEKADAVQKADAANAERVRVTNKAHVANKALSSSKLHAEAANKVLDDAALRVLASDQLLAEASAKALAGAEAAEKALAAAEKKGSPKAVAPVEKPASVSEDPVEEPVEEPIFDDVKIALLELRRKKSAKEVTKLLKRFNVVAAPELPESKYAEVIAAVKKELE